MAWNQVLIVEHYTGDRVAHDFAFKNGEQAVCWFETEEFSNDCEHCLKGECVQLVVQPYGSEEYSVIHNVSRDLN